jgi:3-isopropylmalate dehydrogenase
MMLRYTLKNEPAAAAIESAIDKVLAEGHRTADIAEKGGTTSSTVAIGEARGQIRS